MATDLLRLQHQAARAYEWGRFTRALLLSAPVVLLALAIVSVAPFTWTAIVAGTVLVSGSIAALWRGQTLALAVIPGVLAGLAPLACSFAAQGIGHVCTGSGCVSLCLPLCSAGGIAAGLSLGYLARKQSAPALFLLSAVSLAAAVGTMGCGCVSGDGIWGIVGGLLLGSSTPLLVPSSRARS